VHRERDHQHGTGRQREQHGRGAEAAVTAGLRQAVDDPCQRGESSASPIASSRWCSSGRVSGIPRQASTSATRQTGTLT
jgi:hypothetical protein